VGAKGIEAPEKLNGLEFAAELEFEDIPKNEVISCGKRQRLESGVVQVRIGRSEAAHAQSHGWLGTVGQATRITRAHHCRGQALAIGHVAAEGELAVGKDGAFQSEAGAHVRTGAVTCGSGTGNE